MPASPKTGLQELLRHCRSLGFPRFFALLAKEQRNGCFLTGAGALPGGAGGSSRHSSRGSPGVQLTGALGDPFFWPG